MPRFAGSRLAAGLSELGKYMLPDLSTGRGKFEAVMRFAPDLVFPAVAAMNLPGEATAGDRALVYGELLGQNLGASLLGQGLGFLGGKVYLRGGKHPHGSDAYNEILGHGINTGDIVGQMGSSFLPTPLSNGVYERLAREQQGGDPMQLTEEMDQKTEENKQLIDMLALAGYAAQPYRGYSNTYAMPGLAM